MKSLDVILGFLEMLIAIGSREIYQHRDTLDISVIFTYSNHTAKGAIVLMNLNTGNVKSYKYIYLNRFMGPLGAVS